jgi:ribosomal-protein-alanine N-acetyltransferase
MILEAFMDQSPVSYRLVPMAAELIPDIAEIERLCFSQPWSENALHEELFNDTACFIAAVTETGETIGYAGLHCILDEGYIDNVAVRPEYRRQGVAAQLLEAFLRFGRAKLSFLTLEVRASNDPAIGLYKKYGFLEVGRRKNYYTAPVEDAILMTLEFEHGTEKT